MEFVPARITPGLVPPEEYPPATRGEVVVWGLLASSPFGGMTWQVLHHLVGLRRLGFDVWYVEDSDQPFYDPYTFDHVYDLPAPTLRFLTEAMAAIGFAHRWAVRSSTRDTVTGCLDAAGLAALYRRAAAVFNLCGSHEVTARHDDIRCLIYLETDPGWSQVSLAQGAPELADAVDRHDHLFTYGTRIGAEDCLLPAGDRTWHPTLPPVVVEWWSLHPQQSTNNALTTIANWRHSGKDVQWQGRSYRWSKDVAFTDYLDLPSRSPVPLELALGAIGGEEVDDLRRRGWRVVPSYTLADPGTYRDYVSGSLGEFTVTKQQYVATGSGWFSDRSACYLAAGRPVVTQDTGISASFPRQEGLLLFTDPEQASACLEAVASEPDLHRKAAAELACEHFAAERVLGDVAARAGLL